MPVRIVLLLLAALALGTSGCVVTTVETGAVMSDGSVYLGFNLFDSRGRPDREQYLVGQNLGAFSTIRLVADSPIDITRVLVVFADGERWVAPVAPVLGGGQSTPRIGLPRGPRPIYAIAVAGKSRVRGLAKIEIYGTH